MIIPNPNSYILLCLKAEKYFRDHFNLISKIAVLFQLEAETTLKLTFTVCIVPIRWPHLLKVLKLNGILILFDSIIEKVWIAFWNNK